VSDNAYRCNGRTDDWDGISWKLTEQERRRAFAAAVAVASSFVGPFAPFVMWGFDYLYDRRDLIFSRTGAPVQAIASDSSVLRLPALSQLSTQPPPPCRSTQP